MHLSNQKFEMDFRAKRLTQKHTLRGPRETDPLSSLPSRDLRLPSHQYRQLTGRPQGIAQTIARELHYLLYRKNAGKRKLKEKEKFPSSTPLLDERAFWKAVADRSLGYGWGGELGLSWVFEESQAWGEGSTGKPGKRNLKC